MPTYTKSLNMRPNQWIAYTALFAIFSLFTARFCLQKTDRFMISKITSNRPYDPLFEVTGQSGEAESEVRRALSQKYTYLAAGGQAFVFLSEDGNYVIKFFKQRH